MTSPLKEQAFRFHPASSPDFVPRTSLDDLQSRRLVEVVRRAYASVPLYRERMRECDLRPEDIRGIEDIVKLPFTYKNDLRDAYPSGLFASSMRDVARLHASSAAGDKLIVVAYHRSDLEVWTSVMVRTLAAVGLHEGDIVQNSFGYGLFPAGLGFHYGAEALGVTLIPTSGGNTDRQLTVMKDFGVSAICCTPSYFLQILDRAQELGADLRQWPLRAGLFGAEPWTEAIRRHIEQAADIRAFDCYGLPELTGPGVGAECHRQDGLHVFEDHFYPEVVDPGSGEPLPDGQIGELVITTLSKQAMPMLRYRTRDLTALVAEPCGCGRTLRRIRRVTQRLDDMFTVQGVSVFPAQIESAILESAGSLPQYQIVLTRSRGLDQVEVQIEVTPRLLSDQISAMENLQTRLAAQIARAVGMAVEVRLVEPQSLARSEEKTQRVIDNRAI
jgi:phenylacetate-CoA ligase